MRSNHYRPEKPVYRGPWKTVRRRVLERDNHTCQIGLPGCLGQANSVDHIVPVALGGDWYNLDNLRAACAPCNGELAKITQKHVAQQRRDTPTTDTPTTPPPPTVQASREW